MMTNPKSSLFVTFEGGEGAGKSSLINALRAALNEKGLAVTHTREPGGSALGEQIRQLLLNQGNGKISDMAELLLFLASRAQHVDELIKPALDDGKIVLCDRFSDSTVAYQGHARGLGASTVRQMCDFAAGGLKPDLTFLLDLDPEVGFKRIKRAVERGAIDRIESETAVFHKKVRQGFLAEAGHAPERVCILDASLSENELFNKAWEKLVDRLDLTR